MTPTETLRAAATRLRDGIYLDLAAQARGIPVEPSVRDYYGHPVMELARHILGEDQ